MTSPSTPLVPGWGPLTYELGRAASPVAVHFTTRYPYAKAVQHRYRDSAGPILIGSAGAHPGTLGTAFDWAVRFQLHPFPSPDLALAGVWRRSPALADAAMDLILRLGIAVDDDGAAGVATFTGPAAGSTADRELLLRGCWALALLTEVFRIGGVHPQSALAALDGGGRIDADDLLAIAPTAAVDELGQLADLAATALVAPIAQRTGVWALGPAFEGSRLMAADADFIAGGLLVEMKSGLGGKRADGTRRLGLDGSTLYQLLGYALLDFADEYALDSVAVYAARYGHLARWPLAELLRELTGRATDLATERAALRSVLLPVLDIG
ncbi:hypothetical protein F4553_000258 [Allocatelliglobosispora scoriae]|uniref:Uncharacterized protein n=1 Tax=Allocatelliglobosispora scoriae TaxID=643052 RepID=A0A841BI83_9ACTN|nr:hypothetical protein [Allocatelliglobosispora scoriae]MBB5866879.1 hypothetical protein [Allocatelliglobosispora scoriae]